MNKSVILCTQFRISLMGPLVPSVQIKNALNFLQFDVEHKVKFSKLRKMSVLYVHKSLEKVQLIVMHEVQLGALRGTF